MIVCKRHALSTGLSDCISLKQKDFKPSELCRYILYRMWIYDINCHWYTVASKSSNFTFLFRHLVKLHYQLYWICLKYTTKLVSNSNWYGQVQDANSSLFNINTIWVSTQVWTNDNLWYSTLPIYHLIPHAWNNINYYILERYSCYWLVKNRRLHFSISGDGHVISAADVQRAIIHFGRTCVHENDYCTL